MAASNKTATKEEKQMTFGNNFLWSLAPMALTLEVVNLKRSNEITFSVPEKKLNCSLWS